MICELHELFVSYNRLKTEPHLTAREKKMAVKSTQKKSAAKKATAKKAAAKKAAPRKKSTRKYSPAASRDVETEMKEMKAGKLRSGRSGRKVTSRKQAIAIGLSKARKEGKKVPQKKS